MGAAKVLFAGSWMMDPSMCLTRKWLSSQPVATGERILAQHQLIHVPVMVVA